MFEEQIRLFNLKPSQWLKLPLQHVLYKIDFCYEIKQKNERQEEVPRKDGLFGIWDAPD